MPGFGGIFVLKHDRFIKIREYLTTNGAVSTKALSDCLGVSVVTVRKDLDEMEQLGFVKRTHGGAMLMEAPKKMDLKTPGVTIPSSIDILTDLAKNYVRPGDFIFIGSGRTCLSLAEKIKTVEGISVITNNVSAVNVLKPYVEDIILLGGEIIMTPDGLFATSDSNLISTTNGIFVGKAFSSGVGINPDTGLTVNNMLSTYVSRAIPQWTSDWYVMADSSKFGIRAFYQAAGLEKMRHLVTDISDESVLREYRVKAPELDIIHP